MLIEATALERYLGDVFVREGCSAAEGARIGRSLVGANLTGHDSHGVIRAPRYMGWLRDGTVRAGQAPEIVTDGGAFALIDAHFGFGQSAGPVALAEGIARAGRHGVSVVALRHSGHLGRIGEWAEQAAEAGFVSIHFVNVAGSLLVAPFGGVDRRFSTAPFAAGVPVAGGPPIVLDFATSLVAEGKVLVAAKGGKPVPEGSLIEPDGRLSRDPDTLYSGRGALRAFGEHKGSGLAMMCELLAGALTGSGCAGPPPKSYCNGMLSIYLAPDIGGSAAGFADEVRRYIAFYRDARPAEAGGRVLAPGDIERETRARRRVDGIPLTPEVWDSLRALGAPHGIDAESYRTGSLDP